MLGYCSVENCVFKLFRSLSQGLISCVGLRVSSAIGAVLLVWFTGTVAAQDAGPRPLIFIPGIFGSKLCQDGDPKKVLWGSVTALSLLPKLKLHADGKTSDVVVKPCGEIDEFVYFGPLGQDIYGNFLQALDTAGYKRDKNLFVFAYDWRLSNFENAKILEAEIEKYAALAKLGPSGQFDVVAHSMGGLIITILQNSANPRIARVVTVSTPFQGSVKLFSSLEIGWGWIQRKLVSMKQVRETVLSFPSLYELLPTYRNCCALGSGRPGKALDMRKAEDLQRIAWLRDVSNEELTSRLDSLVKLRALSARSQNASARLYGVKEETPEQIYLAPEQDADPDHLIRKIVPSWLGDGTVMDYSAMRDNDLGRLPGAILHERIMSDPQIFDQIRIALGHRGPPDVIAGAPLARCATSNGDLEIDGATIEGRERLNSPEQEVSLDFYVRSSSDMQDPSVLRSIAIEGLVVSPNGNSPIRFDPQGQPQFDKEQTKDGPLDFYTQKFSANFRAPRLPGDAKIEVRCRPQQRDSIASWDFRVAE
jgi:pimeloyl-ACP methyl ester carboxylesterase